MSDANTPPSTTPPARGGGDPHVDVVAGDPPVPITVWRTPAGDEQAAIPARLAQRVLSAYSRPGEVVIDLTAGHTLSEAACHGGRRHHPGWVTETTAVIIGARTTCDPAGQDASPPQPVPGRRGEPGPADAAARYGHDLTDPAPFDGVAGQGAARVRGAAALVVAAWPLHPDGDGHGGRLRGLLHACRSLLRAGGCLVLVVPAPADAGRPRDFGPLTAAAAAEGLGYLQHIVAVRADVQADQFTYYATDTDLRALTEHRRWPLAHRNVHADLCVYTSRGGGHD